MGRESPTGSALVTAAERRRALLKALGEVRERAARSQTSVAAGMQSSQSSVARLERSASDARLSTIDRFAEALGYRVQRHLIPVENGEEPPVVIHERGP